MKIITLVLIGFGILNGIKLVTHRIEIPMITTIERENCQIGGSPKGIYNDASKNTRKNIAVRFDLFF